MQSFVQDRYFREHVRGRENPRVTAWFFHAYVSHITAPPVLREARALAAFWDKADILAYPQELVVGSLFAAEVAWFHYGDGVVLDRKRLEEYVRQNGLDAQAYGEMADRVEKACYQNPYQPGFRSDRFTEEQKRSLYSTAATSTWFGGHMAMDYEKILKVGLGGYRKELALEKGSHPEAKEFYEALEVTLSAFQRLILRTALVCEQLASCQEEDVLRENMERAALTLRAVAEEPPAGFREALQLVVMVHLCSNADSFGRFDKYLFPFFQRDLEQGRLTEEEALDLLQSLIIKVEQLDQIQNMTLGGVLPDGSGNYTRLTELMLKAVSNMGYKGPNLALRVHPSMPQHFWPLITSCLATGKGLPALYNDEEAIPALQRGGYPLELARDYCLGGCSQIMFGGRSQFLNDIGLMNVAKIFELTLHNGRDVLDGGKQISPATGEAWDFPDFDSLYRAFLRQLEYFIPLEAEINTLDVLERGKKEGYAFRSLFTRGCIESGKGIYEGGPLYQNVQLECIGITNTADSLYAVKKAVYQEKRLTLAELVEILDNIFEGQEELRDYLRGLDKFGNDREEVDSLRMEITRFLFDGLRGQKGPFGGRYIPGEVIFTAHELCGAHVGATPDGRLRGEVLADSAGSSQGMNRNGPTALLNSVRKLPTEEMVTSIVVNLKFHRAFFEKHQEEAAALLRAYFRGGGQQVQVNVCDKEELKDAVLHPERHQDLIVRVGGYSDYFVRLSPALQQEIILRSESVV